MLAFRAGHFFTGQQLFDQIFLRLEGLGAALVDIGKVGGLSCHRQYLNSSVTGKKKSAAIIALPAWQIKEGRLAPPLSMQLEVGMDYPGYPLGKHQQGALDHAVQLYQMAAIERGINKSGYLAFDHDASANERHQVADRVEA